MKKEMDKEFKLNLQLHAEPEGEAEDSNANPPQDEQEGAEDVGRNDQSSDSDQEGDSEKRFTRKDLNAVIATAVKKAQEEAKAEMEEQKRLSKLSAEEKNAEELKRLREELEGYKSKEAYNTALGDTKKELEERKLPLGFAEFLVNADSAKALEGIKAFEKAYREEVQKAVEERLKNPTPPKNYGHEDKSGKPSLPRLNEY